MLEIGAKVLAHSVNYANENHQLITIQTIAPYFLDAEIEKHRMISSNSSSNRAIPITKTTTADYFIPEDVRFNQKGMQGELRVEGELLG